MANICKDWEVWMLNSEIIASTAKPQIKKLIVEWVQKEYNNVVVEVVVNSWKNGKNTWFNFNQIVKHISYITVA